MLKATSNKSFETFHVLEKELWLLPEKGIFIPFSSTLLLADIHLGKATHFQKRGLNVSSQVIEKDLKRINELILKYDAKRVVFLGDLFHAERNKEWDRFTEWLQERKHIQFILIKGNHDRLPFDAYEEAGIKVHLNNLQEPPFLYIHEPFENQGDIPEGLFAFAGHVHPATTISGKGRQTIQVESFCFYDRQAILPAFGSFTGTFVKCDSKNEFVIAGNSVIRTR